MQKKFLIGVASAAMLGAAFLPPVYAQSPAPPAPPPAQTAPPPPPAPVSPPAETAPRADAPVRPTDNRPPDNQIANEVDAQVALLKARLQLTVDQERNWPALQTALHDFGVARLSARTDERMRRDRRRDRDRREDAAERENDIALMRQEADALVARADALRKLADAADPLYGALDNRQKAKLMQFMARAFDGRR